MNTRGKTRVFRLALALTLALALLAPGADAQRKKEKPDASQAAMVQQTIGATDTITINYHRPGIKGRNVWTEESDNPRIGRLVPFDGQPFPWRAGANEATTITFTADVKVEGKDLPAGTYALAMIPRESGDWTVIFNKRDRQWGTFNYKQEEDALRVDVKVEEAPHQEWLVYGFDNPEAYSTTAYLHWEKVKVPFKIELAKQE